MAMRLSQQLWCVEIGTCVRVRPLRHPPSQLPLRPRDGRPPDEVSVADAHVRISEIILATRELCGEPVSSQLRRPLQGAAFFEGAARTGDDDNVSPLSVVCGRANDRQEAISRANDDQRRNVNAHEAARFNCRSQ